MVDEPLVVSKALDNLRAIQSVIDGRITSLDGLRKLVGSSDYTQQEIKTVEGKLAQLFGRQLAIKQRVKNNGYPLDNELNQFPNLRQLLHVVDIQGNAKEKMLDKLQDLSELLEMTEYDIRAQALHCECDEKTVKRLLTACKNLKRAYKAHLFGTSSNLKDVSDKEPTDTSSYTSNSPESTSPKQKRTSTSSVGSASSEPPSIRVPPTPPPLGYPSEHYSRNQYTVTPPTTPKQWGKKTVAKGTPPPNKKMITVNLPPPESGLKRSKSTEASLPHRIDIEGGGSLSRMRGSKIPAVLKKQTSSGSCEANLNYSRRFSEDTMDSRSMSPQKGMYNSVSAFDTGKARTPPPVVACFQKGRQPYNGAISLSKSETCLKPDTLAVPPRSPRAPRSNMVHSIKHRFSRKKFFPPPTCDYCHKIMLHGYKCKDCKYVCHSKCQPLAEKVRSCGLPPGYEEVFKVSYENKYGRSGAPSPLLIRRTAHSEANLPHTGQDHRYPAQGPAFSHGESSSNPSSTNSSTSSSPVPFTASSSSTTPPTPAHPSPSPHMDHCKPQFQFPDVTVNGLLNPNFDGDTFHSSINSDRTITIDSHNSNDSHDPFTDSERTLPEKVECIDDMADMADQVLHRKNSHKSNVLSEWDIPPDQLEITELIGTGRFGPVYKGRWHGDVAVKMLDIDMSDEEQLQAFKTEVSQFKKTRHDYVVLFMGTYLKPPDLAIVTSLCRGMTLYTRVHQRGERFGMNKAIVLATQIAQGMGYLHAKGIIHKDLKSKNIFLENGKVVITDFALFSIMRLSRDSRRPNVMVIPDGWLCYLAPELITALRVDSSGSSDRELPFSTTSDIYSFGTIWYELLAGCLPFYKELAESIIWRVGKGIKQPLTHLQASKDVKDVLMMCWNYNPEKRPEFTDIIKTLNRLPKKRGGLHRSPSHPLHLSRSAESVL